MAPPQENDLYRQAPLYASEPKRMRVSAAGRTALSVTTTTRASTGAPAAMTNKGSVYKAQRGKAVTAAAVKKAPTTHRRRGRKGKSVYRGVCVTREGKWRAVIYKERKQLYLGVYESEVDAAKAHDRAARFHFAENAVCNFDSEHEADRQALIHKERVLLQQQQLADDRVRNAQLHGGGFSVGREEFDDLEEYHRGLDEASSSEEGGEGEGEGDGDGEGVEDGEESYPSDSCVTRTSRSFSTSSLTSTGSMSDDYAAREEATTVEYESSYDGRGVAVPQAAAVAAAGVVGGRYAGGDGGVVGAGLHCDGSVPMVGGGGGRIRGNSAGGESSDSDFTSMSALLQDLEPTPLEGMGFPYAENLLGYEMQSWYSGHGEGSPSFAGPMESLSRTSLDGHVGSMDPTAAAGASVGWGFAELRQSGRQDSSSSMSSSCFSCDDDYVPCALPPLMGMCADP